MNIECSHCGAMNPAESIFCGECGWQIMPADAEVEIEAFIASLQRTDVQDVVSTEPGSSRTETEAGQADLAAAPGEATAGGEKEFEPVPVAITTNAEARQANLKIAPEEQPARGEAEPEPKPSQEVLSFEDGEGITITSSVAVFGDRIYARADIISVEMETIRADRWPSLLLAAFGAIILAFAVASLGRDTRLSLILIAGGLALLAIGALLAVTAHDQYLVCVQTAGGVEAALASANRERVQRIVQVMRSNPRGQDLIQQG